MKWIETIKIQAAGGQEAALKEELISMATATQSRTTCKELVKIGIAQHITLPGYFVVHLWRDSETPPEQGSQAGLSLVQALESFGLVEHAGWVELI